MFPIVTLYLSLRPVLGAPKHPERDIFPSVVFVYTRAKGRKRGNAIIIPEIGSTLASVSAVKHSSLESHKPSRLYTPLPLPPLMCCMTCSCRVQRAWGPQNCHDNECKFEIREEKMFYNRNVVKLVVR